VGGQKRSSKGSRFLIVGLLLLLSLSAYWPMFANSFVWDDQEFIVKNRAIRSLWSPAYLWGCPGPGYPWLGQRPVVALSFALDYALWKGNPRGYHLANFLLHLSCTLGVFFLAQNLFRDWVPAFAAGALFAVHPGHGEAVVAFLGRSDLLATTFVLLAALAYLGSWQGKRKLLLYGLSLGSFLLGCLAKETALGFLGIVLFLDGLRQKAEGGTWYSSVVRVTPFVLVALFYGIYRHSILAGEPTRFTWWSGNTALGVKALFGAFAEYLRLFLFPLRLTPWYEVSAPGAGLDGKAFLGFLSLCFILWALLLFWKRDARKALSLGWFLSGMLLVLGGWLLPLSGLKGLGGLPGPVVAERWLYLPSVGGCLLAGVGFNFWLARAEAWGKVFILVTGCALLSLLLWRQLSWIPIWRSEESLARTLVAQAPRTALGYYNLANALARKGDLDGAEGFYRQAIQLKPDYAKAYNNIGVVFARMGRREEAEQEYREALRLNPVYAEPHNNLGNLHADQGRGDEAEKEYREALRLDPEYSEAHYNQGTLFEDQKRFPEAEREYQEAIRLRPDYVQAHNNLGNVFARQGDYFRAEGEYRVAIRLDSLFAGPCINLALVLVRQGRREEAVGILEAFLSQGGQPRAQVEAVLRDLKGKTSSGK
jgi:Flp pilus assembly protein TadD